MLPHTRRLLKALVLVASVTAAGLGVVACGGKDASPGPTVEGTLSAAQRSLNGRITYAGTSLANHKIVIAVNRQAESSPAYSATITKTGNYTISNVADGTYTVIAFIDLGDDMGPPQPEEPLGLYDAGGDGVPDAVVMKAGAPVTGLDITIQDRRR